MLLRTTMHKSSLTSSAYWDHPSYRPTVDRWHPSSDLSQNHHDVRNVQLIGLAQKQLTIVWSHCAKTCVIKSYTRGSSIWVFGYRHGHPFKILG